MTIILHRRAAGHYWTNVDGIEYELLGPDPCYPPELGYQWSLESHELNINVQYFRTMRDARKYLNTIANVDPHDEPICCKYATAGVEYKPE